MYRDWSYLILYRKQYMVSLSDKERANLLVNTFPEIHKAHNYKIWVSKVGKV